MTTASQQVARPSAALTRHGLRKLGPQPRALAGSKVPPATPQKPDLVAATLAPSAIYGRRRAQALGQASNRAEAITEPTATYAGGGVRNAGPRRRGVASIDVANVYAHRAAATQGHASSAADLASGANVGGSRQAESAAATVDPEAIYARRVQKRPDPR
jgi:hypothetical protein